MLTVEMGLKHLPRPLSPYTQAFQLAVAEREDEFSSEHSLLFTP